MDQRITVAALARPIALALEGVWQPQKGYFDNDRLDHVATLTHEDGRRLHLSERWDEPGFLVIRGVFPATDYPFRRGDRDSLRVPMTESPDVIAALVSERLIPRHREVWGEVFDHNQRLAQLCREVEALASGLSERLPGARTRVDGTTAFVHLELESGEFRIVIDGPEVNLFLTDVPDVIANAMVFAVSRFLPHVETLEGESGNSFDEINF
ncbi:hypothetical protein [Streptomyces jumonjinensis]|uniref:Uncharacterized protein n=1 Tax=Streptomyces jumonjinensis TaxID=1945 RepID=A0A646KRZ7_STRJU|nr:hypothetical protein [Streptomyces jumonjinensis]MQT05104.1 hypothetical protein [Streptomyces jumonjinensis]